MTSRHSVAVCLAAALVLAGSTSCSGTAGASAGWLQYGGMHQTIAQQQHQGRVSLEALRATPHLYGVGALEGLSGELTVLDGRTVVSGVDAQGQARPADQDGQATLFAGQPVVAWTPVVLTDAVEAEAFDALVKARAEAAGLDTSTPFVFVVEGRFDDLRLHVLNGACPVHARMRAQELPADRHPWEWQGDGLEGTLVALYAEGSVGGLTHPATSVHGHLVFLDPVTGERLTAHVERLALAPGATLQLPADA